MPVTNPSKARSVRSPWHGLQLGRRPLAKQQVRTCANKQAAPECSFGSPEYRQNNPKYAKDLWNDVHIMKYCLTNLIFLQLTHAWIMGYANTSENCTHTHTHIYIYQFNDEIWTYISISCNVCIVADKKTDNQSTRMSPTFSRTLFAMIIEKPCIHVALSLTQNAITWHFVRSTLCALHVQIHVSSRIKSHDPSHKVSELTPKCLLHPVLDGPTSANETLPAATGASYIARRGTGFGGKKWMLKTNIKMAEQHVEFCQLEARSKLKRPLSSSSLIFCNPLKLEWTFVIFEVIQLICCIGAHCKKKQRYDY